MNQIDDDMKRLIIDFEERLGRKVDERERALLQWITVKTVEQEQVEDRME
ncbi:hypothetical protein ABC345_03130 [Shouchella sp. 1P09AA]